MGDSEAEGGHSNGVDQSTQAEEVEEKGEEGREKGKGRTEGIERKAKTGPGSASTSHFLSYGPPYAMVLVIAPVNVFNPLPQTSALAMEDSRKEGARKLAGKYKV